MIDIRCERLINFSEAAAFLPAGSRPNLSTWWRWYTKGWLGVRLETVRAGKRRYTTVEAMQRFITAVTKLDDTPENTAVVPSPPKAERGDFGADKAFAFLSQEGII